MGRDSYYYFDEESYKFVPIQYNGWERLIFTISLWILCGVVLAGSGIAMLSSQAGPPSEIALRAENQELINQLKKNQQKIKKLDQRVKNLAQVDNELLRSMLGMDKIPYDQRKGGVGGTEMYSSMDVLNQETAKLLQETKSSLQSLERQINIQKSSFKQLKQHYNQNQKRLKHLPAIKPVEGILLSGYGMRYHPVLKYKRMHEGVDFRADVGTPIHATGDGVVQLARRKGTYGRLLIIDHGNGIESHYAHLSSFKNNIEPGSEVKRGEVIAYSGNSGVTEGPHLHYEIHRQEETVDPINYLFADITPEEYSMYRRIAQNNPKSMD